MLIIKREYFKTYTKGTLTLPDGSKIFSLELPWLDNKPFFSCIPEDDYFFVRDTHGRHTYFRVLNVSARSAIEFHPANNTSQLQGCIAPCMQIDNGIARASRAACEKMLSFYGDGEEKYLMRIC